MKNSIKKMLIIALSMMMVLALAACGGSGSGDSEEGGGKLAEIQEKGKIVVCTDAAWAPFEYIGEGGEPTGIDIEIAQAIADELGVELEVSNIAFDTIPATLTSGDADLGLACITITEERKEEMAFSDPYTSVQQYMVVTADSDLAAMDDLAGKMIGTHLGTTGDFLVSDEISDGVLKDSGAQNNQYKQLPDAAEELKSGTLSAIVCDSVLAENLVTANGDALKCFPVKYADGTEADIEEIGAAMAKGDDEFTAKINEIIQKLVDEGKVDEWFVQHSEAASKL
ncbi:MAG: transporter substrate-binding domain-containing protein [Mogibacterium sp.]|nr:transporter substrate-binding domain-containing protein [Mogibacterium sp.]MBQ9075538.1 transporter substrate-binding domain-containing protein [Mogibacterium sp.]